jgi:ATP-dependent DNA helicase RecQ
MLTVSEAQLVIDSWVKGHSPDRSTRLGSALAQRSNTRGLGADAAVLIRQVLRHADGVRIDAIPEQPGVTPGTKAWLRLPRDDRFDWKSYGLTSTVHAESVEVTADEWVPDWLSGGSVVDHEVAAGELRRINESVAPDPFLQEIDRSVDSYRTPAQRSAVRSALLLPPGGTLLVNLPTGAGKTLPLLARALLTPPGRTSVIVVPTVALALDQQRRYAEQRPEAPPTAYFGDLTSDAKMAFLYRLRNGQQPVIFTNPEAIATSLARPLGDAAEGGRLELFAVDEAHIVGAWGDSFRPYFHALAGLRNALLRKAVDAGHVPFRTLLATATVTTETLGLLRALFGTPGPFFHVAAPVIRAEPIYWSKEFVKPEDRLERLVEALKFLPRPAIVYTTLRSDTTTKPGILTPRRLLTALTAQGFKRVAVFDGESSASERQRDWV